MNKIIQLGNIRDGTKSFSDPQTGRIYSMYGISPTINTCQSGGKEPKIVVVDKSEVKRMIVNENT